MKDYKGMSMRSDKYEQISGMNKKTYLRDVNPYLICPLCRGYFIDATTVVECLHSFCRSCILKYLQSEARCPSCKDVLNKVKPNIKADKTLQDIVYKLVPGLYHKEMRRRKEFYMKHPEHGNAENLNHLGGAEAATPEQRGEDAASSRLFFAPEDGVSLSLEYLPPGIDPMDIVNAGDTDSMQINTNGTKLANIPNGGTNRRYLQCPALVTIAHLKKFLALKYTVDLTRYNIDICHRRAALPEYMTLMDVAYVYAWKRNAPMRFFYIITKEEQLEAPPNDRPSTPGLGASFPPFDNIVKKDEANKEEEPVNKEELDSEKKSNEVVVLSPSTTSDKVEITEGLKNLPNESVKTNSVTDAASVHDEKAVKSPIKIQKTCKGSYEVLKNSKNVQNVSDQDTVKTDKAEFSVVSVVGDDSNSNGVKITLKQCTPTTNTTRKPKVISNVLLRSPTDKKISVQQMKEEIDKKVEIREQQEIQENKQVEKQERKNKNNKMEKVEKPEKHKRRVTFVEKTVDTETTGKMKPAIQTSTEQQDKMQFLQSFELTTNEKYIPPSTSDSNVIELSKESKETSLTENKVTAEKRVDESPKVEKPKENDTVENKAEISVLREGASDTSISVKVMKKSSLPQSTNTNSTNQDVYAFPNETPVILKGAIKRKCPPGLVITDIPPKKLTFQNQIPKKMPSLINAAKSYRKLIKEPKPITDNVLKSPHFNQVKRTPMSISDTRNLLDECGLNIPAGLSITLTSHRPSSNILSPTESNSGKDNSMTVEKVSPNISLNNKSVDPQVLKAFKTGQMKTAISSTNVNELGQSAKRKREQDILDLSSVKNLEMQPPQLKVPHPTLKTKFSPYSKQQQHGQVVTLVGGQKYYRAPPGSLTPAAHRVADYPSPTGSNRGPVYAPSCHSSPTSNSLSSAFPTLQSLYVLSQSPNLHQFHQMDAKYKLMQSHESSGRSHLAAQCAPIKPPRSSQTSLAVPISKQTTNGHVSIKRILANDSKMANSKHVTFEKQIPTSSSPSNTQNNSSTPAVSLPRLSPLQKSVSSPADRSNLQGAPSPRVSSTVSPSPPPTASSVLESSNEDSKLSVKEKQQPPTESIKSPESPDSSSIVVEKETRISNGDVLSQTEKSSDNLPENTEKEEEKKADSVVAEKSEKKEDQLSENLQKTLLAAFPSKEWINNACQ